MAKKGDSKGVDESIAQLQKSGKSLVDAARDRAKQFSDRSKQKKITDLANSVSDLINQIAEDAKKSAANPQDKKARNKLEEDKLNLKDAIEKLIDATTSDNSVSNAVALKEQIDSLLVSLKDATAADDYNGMSNAANDLCDKMKQLLGDLKLSAEQHRSGKLTDAAKAAMDLSDLLSALEDSSSTPTNIKAISAEEMDNLFSDLNQMALSQPPKNNAQPTRTSKSADKPKQSIPGIIYSAEQMITLLQIREVSRAT